MVLNPKRFYKDLERFVYKRSISSRWRVRVERPVDCYPNRRVYYDFLTGATEKCDALQVAQIFGSQAPQDRSGVEGLAAWEWYDMGYRLRTSLHPSLLARQYVRAQEVDLDILDPEGYPRNV